MIDISIKNLRTEKPIPPWDVHAEIIKEYLLETLKGEKR